VHFLIDPNRVSAQKQEQKSRNFFFAQKVIAYKVSTFKATTGEKKIMNADIPYRA